ncbi:bifunctional folylpolyglutamate synthase/dihydrofolate synthase [Fibrella forsythiae]|uniref:Dihydrofolate synthase/folylpolyglutamate synthase n=1 Tax=Fibrella forsythiae TaxID=2817061 RepID=A0ABS3JD46_9BACT|nr:folylpolyglutamate synthase/dihydrofolate synthase family protein [Fibrella forsythiae]MBO0947371.1 bifunctional folylpolyglutamate synthase/dihydrofolate synthase [Fibrella forsythiae]
MTYNEALSYLYDRLPVFHRVGVSAYKPGLSNVLALCDALGNPQHKFRSIHVAGTNGKGSTSHLLASVYQAAGYRVGLYTSPHLKSFTERIRLNGVAIPEADVAAFVESQQLVIEQIQPSFFEVTVAMAFDFFARQQVDIAIIEVGLGGRLDSTNIITPLVSVITNIGWDHVDILGDTLPLIAAEKGGIVKENVPVVIGEMHPETQPVFEEIADRHRSTIHFADQQWKLTDGGCVDGVRLISCTRAGRINSSFTVELPLLGLYQLSNLKTVLSTVDVMQSQLPVNDEAVEIGCRQVVSLTGLKGRFQYLSQSPAVIADTAHNKPGIEALMATVETITYDRLRLIIGFVRDKDVPAVLSLFPPTAIYYFCQADSVRALPVDELVTLGSAAGLVGNRYPNVNTALDAALAEAGINDLLLITGSTYVVAEINLL